MTQEMLIVSVLAGVLFLYLLYRQRLLTLEFLRLKKKIGPAQGAGPNGRVSGNGSASGGDRELKAGPSASGGDEEALVAALCAAISAYRAAEAARSAQGDSPGFVIRRIRPLP